MLSRTYPLRSGTIRVSDRATWLRLLALDLGLGRAALTLGGAAAPWFGPVRRHRLERWWSGRILNALRVELDVHGTEHIDPRDCYVVVALHESVLDPLVLLQVLGPARFAVRDEIGGWRGVGSYVRASQQVLMSPERGRAAYRRLLRRAPEVFTAGESFVIFPQGTILGIETAFARGPFELAARLRRPLLPIVLTGTRGVWEHPLRPQMRLGQRVGVAVLPPVPATDLAASGAEPVRRRLQREMKRHALEGSLPPPARFDPARDGYWEGYRYEIDGAFPDVAALVARHRARHARRTPTA